MPEHVIWGDQAPAIDIVAPSVEKQHLGWEKEYPPHEFFNWYFNRTDTRLGSLEEPWTKESIHSAPGERTETILAGSEYTVPEYIVGSRNLEVYLDQYPCIEGINGTYTEVGDPLTRSTKIVWNDDIASEYDILIKTPTQLSKKINIVTSSVIDFETMLQAIVDKSYPQEIIKKMEELRAAADQASLKAEEAATVAQNAAAETRNKEVVVINSGETIPDTLVATGGLVVETL